MSTLTRTGYPAHLQEQAQQLLCELSPIASPLRLDDYNILRVGQTRIPIERVIYLYNQGCTPETILDRFDTLDLANVYLLIALYLRHREAVDAYVAACAVYEEEVFQEMNARFPTEGLRELLEARRASAA